MKKLILCIAAILLTAQTPVLASGELTKEQRMQMEKVIREYLLENPEVIRDTIQNLRKKEQAEKAAGVKKLIRDNSDALINAKGDPIAGKKDGKVTVVEFFDYNCPYCRRAKPIVEKLLKSDTRVRYVFKEFPILSPSSKLAAEIALAIWKQNPDKYKEYHWGLMQSQKRLDESDIKAQVEKLGLNWQALKKEAETDSIQKKIQQNIALAQKLGINGTPSFIIGEEFFPGLVPYEKLQYAVNRVCTQPVAC